MMNFGVSYKLENFTLMNFSFNSITIFLCHLLSVCQLACYEEISVQVEKLLNVSRFQLVNPTQLLK
jgi:hypothetical protein